MRYYIVNESLKIEDVYHSLRELKESITDSIDLMDYIDDRTKTLSNGTWILTEDLLNNYIKKEIEESDNHSVKNQMELRLEVTDLKEKLDEANSEIDSVHDEVVSLESELDATQATLSDLDKLKAKLLSNVESLEANLKEYEGILTEYKDRHITLRFTEINTLVNDIVEELVTSDKEVSMFVGGLDIE